MPMVETFLTMSFAFCDICSLMTRIAHCVLDPGIPSAAVAAPCPTSALRMAADAVSTWPANARSSSGSTSKEPPEGRGRRKSSDRKQFDPNAPRELPNAPICAGLRRMASGRQHLIQRRVEQAKPVVGGAGQRLGGVLRMRHQADDAAVGRADARDVAHRAVGVVAVAEHHPALALEFVEHLLAGHIAALAGFQWHQDV